MKVQGKTASVSGGTAIRTLFSCILLAAAAFAYSKRTEITERIAIIQSNWKRMHSESANTPNETLETSISSPASKAGSVELASEPAPVVEAATPTPAPTPSPASVVAVIEPTLDHDAIAAAQALWPKQVSLTKPMVFPIVFNGRVAGEASVPAGTVLALSRVVAGATGGVEVVYQGTKRIIPGGSTDLIPRATAMMKAVGTGGSTERAVSNAPTKHSAPPSVAEAASRPAAVASVSSEASSVKPAERITVEVVRKKATRTEGGDWDDKKDRISLKVKFVNLDSKIAFDNFKVEVYTYGQSILDPKITKLLGAQTFPFSLPAFGKHEISTDECTTEYDTTGARFGYQYQGWIIRIHDAKGNLVIEKATNPTLAKSAEKLIKLRVNQETAR